MDDIFALGVIAVVAIGGFAWAWRRFFTAEQKTQISTEADYLKTKGEDLVKRGVNEFSGKR